MARPRDPKLEAQRRAAVLDVVQSMLSEGSYTGMTLAEVARRAGVSKGVVTYWFPSKDDLIVAAVERFHADYARRLTEVALSDASPRERMRDLIAVAFPSRAQVAREVRFQLEAWSFAKTHAPAARRLRDAHNSFRQACEALVAVGIDAGYITTTDVEGLHVAVHALMDGVSMQLAFDAKANIQETRELLLRRVEQWFR